MYFQAKDNRAQRAQNALRHGENMRMYPLLLHILAVLLTVATGAPDSTPAVANKAPHDQSTVPVQILAINDFHGQIAPGKKINGRSAGGAPALGAYCAEEQRTFAGPTFLVHAGDLVGASPPQSALLQDEPTIMFFNSLLDSRCGKKRRRARLHCNGVGIPGNHEFDEGADEFFRLIEGGNHPDGPFLEKPYTGARFPYVCANVFTRKSGKPILPPYVIRKVQRTSIAFVGAALQKTPSAVTPTGVADLRFGDEVAGINRAVEELVCDGVRAIIVLIHQGGAQAPYEGKTRADAGAVSGPIVDIIQNLHDEVDVVIGGHTHRFTNAYVKNKNGKTILTVQAWSAGTAFADIEIAIDRDSHDITEKAARIVTVWADSALTLAPHAASSALLDTIEKRVGVMVNEVIAQAGRPISRRRNAAGESALGNLIADAQRAAMNVDFAFMNPGGIRADCDSGQLTRGELYAIQPFNNYLIEMKLSGQQIYEALNQQWRDQKRPRMLQVSGLTYEWDPAAPPDDRVVCVCANGSPIDRGKTYTVAVNSFLAAGGDAFTIFTSGADTRVGPIDLDALVSYIKQLDQPFTASIDGRITVAGRKAADRLLE